MASSGVAFHVISMPFLRCLVEKITTILFIFQNSPFILSVIHIFKYMNIKYSSLYNFFYFFVLFLRDIHFVFVYSIKNKYCNVFYNRIIFFHWFHFQMNYKSSSLLLPNHIYAIFCFAPLLVMVILSYIWFFVFFYFNTLYLFKTKCDVCVKIGQKWWVYEQKTKNKIRATNKNDWLNDLWSTRISFDHIAGFVLTSKK